MNRVPVMVKKNCISPSVKRNSPLRKVNFTSEVHTCAIKPLFSHVGKSRGKITDKNVQKCDFILLCLGLVCQSHIPFDLHPAKFA